MEARSGTEMGAESLWKLYSFPVSSLNINAWSVATTLGFFFKSLNPKYKNHSGNTVQQRLFSVKHLLKRSVIGIINTSSPS